MEDDNEIVPVKLGNGAIIHIQTTTLGGKEAIGYDLAQFKDFTDALGEISQAVLSTLKKAKPRRGSVEFGLEVGLESGKLTALLMKGTGTANLKITLEWGDLDTDMQP